MPFLKKRNKPENKEDVVYIGFKIEEDIASFFSLYCLAFGITKSSQLQQLLYQWQEKISESYSEENLISFTATRALEVWNTMPKRNITFATFRASLKTEFKYKGLEKKTIDKIITLMTNEKNSEQ